MTIIGDVQGLFVSATAPFAYDFTTPEGRKMKGTARKAYVLTAPGEKPMEVIFEDEYAADFDKLRAEATFGQVVMVKAAPGYGKAQAKYRGDLRVEAASAPGARRAG